MVLGELSNHARWNQFGRRTACLLPGRNAKNYHPYRFETILRQYIQGMMDFSGAWVDWSSAIRESRSAALCGTRSSGSEHNKDPGKNGRGVVRKGCKVVGSYPRNTLIDATH